MTDVENERKRKRNKKKAPDLETTSALSDDELLALQNLSVNDGDDAGTETTEVTEVDSLNRRDTDHSELAGGATTDEIPSAAEGAVADEAGDSEGASLAEDGADGDEPPASDESGEGEDLEDEVSLHEGSEEEGALEEGAAVDEETDDAHDATATTERVTRDHLKGLLEALIFASDKPMTTAQVARAASSVIKEIKPVLEELKAEYAPRGIQLDEVAGGWIFRTKAVYAPFVRDMTAEKPVRLTRAQLETLAILAYRQPVTRPEIDDIRGVDCGPVLKLLLERDLVRMMGKKEEPGRPILYGTTTAFLEFFGLKSLKDLPTLKEFTELNDDSKRIAERELGEVLDDRQPLGAAPPQPVEKSASAMLDAQEAEEARQDAEGAGESDAGLAAEETDASGDAPSDGEDGDARAAGAAATAASDGDDESDEEEGGDDDYVAPPTNADDEAEFPDDDDDDFDDDDDDDDDDDGDDDDDESDDGDGDGDAD